MMASVKKRLLFLASVILCLTMTVAASTTVAGGNSHAAATPAGSQPQAVDSVDLIEEADSVEVEDSVDLIEEADSVEVEDSVDIAEDTDSVEVEVTAASLFAEMPDSLLPSLTHNNRLDLIDFLQSGMKGIVTNRFDEDTEMTSLTNEALSVKVSPTQTFELMLFWDTTTDSGAHCPVVCIKRTYGLGSEVTEQVYSFFHALDWHAVDARHIRLSPADYRLLGKEKELEVLKWAADKLKKD